VGLLRSRVGIWEQCRRFANGHAGSDTASKTIPVWITIRLCRPMDVCWSLPLSVTGTRISMRSTCNVAANLALIDSERMEDQAAFSPDGKFIYFVSSYSGNADIYRLPFFSTKLRR
jgi:hypothetical protein